MTGYQLQADADRANGADEAEREARAIMQLHVFKEENGADFYLASDRAHALALWVADTGMAASDADFTEMADTTVLPLRNDDGGTDSKTCAEWAREVGCPGAFAGENY